MWAIFKGSALFAQGGTQVVLLGEAVKRDIRIMERIFSRLLEKDAGRVSFGEVARGMYLEDYGFLFVISPDEKAYYLTGLLTLPTRRLEQMRSELRRQMAESGKQLQQLRERLREELRAIGEDTTNAVRLGEIPQLDLELRKVQVLTAQERGLQKQVESLQKSFQEMEALQKEQQRGQKDYEEQLKERIMEFLATYADVADYLKPQEWFAVALLPPSDAEGPSVYRVQKQHILDHRRGRIPFDQFRTRVQEVKDGTPALQRELSVMEEVLEYALKFLKDDLKTLSRPKSIKSVYLPGYGAIFDIEWSSAPWFDFEEALDIPLKTRGRARETHKRFQQDLVQVRKEIMEILGDYGPSLRSLESQEWICVFLTFRSSWDRSVSDILLRVKKADVEAFGQRKISRKQFNSRIQVVEF